MTYLVQGSDGAVYGPVDVPTLQAWAQEGRITPDTWLTASVDSPPFRAGEMPDLQPFWPSPSGLLNTTCPHCGQTVTGGAAFCPSCGYGGRPLVTGMGMPTKHLTGRSLTDYLLGLLPTSLLLLGPAAWTLIVPGSLSLFSVVLWLMIGLVPVIVALVLLSSYRTVKRGVGTGLGLGCVAVPLLVTLGLFSAVHSFFSTPFKPCNTP